MSIKAPHLRGNWHDALDAQMALWRWYRTPVGKMYMADSAAANINFPTLHETRAQLRDMYYSESERLINCDPIFVSAEMCDVIEVASESFAPEKLLETDIITPRGFLFFEKPFLVPDRFESPTTIAGASWSRFFRASGEQQVRELNERFMSAYDEGNYDLARLAQLEAEAVDEYGVVPFGISLTIYADTAFEYSQHGNHSEKMREAYGGAAWQTFPRLVPLHLTPWYFGMSFDGNEWDEVGKPTGAIWWWRILQSTFRLMQQRIAVKHFERPERQARHEAKRVGMRPDTEVVVVRLRREKGEPAEPTGESANYSHRFIVGGHWRNQPYESLGIYRQIWIAPYVKGPKDKPLIVRPKRVYQWDR